MTDTLMENIIWLILIFDVESLVIIYGRKRKKKTKTNEQNENENEKENDSDDIISNKYGR